MPLYIILHVLSPRLAGADICTCMLCNLCVCKHMAHSQYHMLHRGGGGGLESSSLPPEILKLNMIIILAIYMLLNVGMCHQNIVWKFCPRLHQKQSERM